MKQEQQLLYMNTDYKILSVEQEFIIHPAALGLIPLGPDAVMQNFKADYLIKEYQFLLNNLTLTGSKPTSPIARQEEGKTYSYGDFKVAYNGSILIGSDLVKEYRLNENEIAAFSYQKVYELVFEDGILITTIDQSKAMLRIRKNIELGLRCLHKKNDARCIRRFMNSSLIGDYKPFFIKHNRNKYLLEMKNNYIHSNSIKQIPSVQQDETINRFTCHE